MHCNLCTDPNNGGVVTWRSRSSDFGFASYVFMAWHWKSWVLEVESPGTLKLWKTQKIENHFKGTLLKCEYCDCSCSFIGLPAWNWHAQVLFIIVMFVDMASQTYVCPRRWSILRRLNFCIKDTVKSKRVAHGHCSNRLCHWKNDYKCRALILFKYWCVFDSFDFYYRITSLPFPHHLSPEYYRYPYLQNFTFHLWVTLTQCGSNPRYPILLTPSWRGL